MRTVKTVIHTIVKCRGEAVLGCLNKIQDPQSSEMLPYIRFNIDLFLYVILTISIYLENY